MCCRCLSRKSDFPDKTNKTPVLSNPLLLLNRIYLGKKEGKILLLEKQDQQNQLRLKTDLQFNDRSLTLKALLYSLLVIDLRTSLVSSGGRPSVSIR